MEINSERRRFRFGTNKTEATASTERPARAPRKRSPFLWGYLRITTKFGGTCWDGCRREIKTGESCFWQTKRHVLRCDECPPDESIMLFDEQAHWYESLTPEQHLLEFPPLSEEERLELEEEQRAARRADGLPFDGVVLWEGDNDEEGSDSRCPRAPDNEREGREGGRVTSSNASLSEDAPSAKNLTDPHKLLAMPFDELLTDVTPKLDYHLRDSHRRSAGRFDLEDLRGVAHLKLVQVMRKFSGAGTFGGFLDAVIPRALIDHARHERRHEAAESLSKTSCAAHEFEHDPTDLWIEMIDLKDAMRATPDGELLLLAHLGIPSKSIGDPAVIDMRRSRARNKVLRLAA